MVGNGGSQFYEKKLSVIARNMKLFIETITYIAIKESPE